jgi:uncharacterized repeat protein (TIGR01451 family)
MKRRGFSPLLGRLLLLLAALTLTASVLALGASAAPAPAPYANGFENADNVDSVTYPSDAMYSVTRVASGTGGITSSSGNWHAAAGVGSGAFTRYGGYSSVFPTGGYTTSADIYLDTSASPLGADLRFDWDSAISATSGGFRRDFVFNVATDGIGGFVVAGSNNSGRSGANPLIDPSRYTISTSGWYTFQHRFYSNGGVLAVEMTVRAAGSTAPLASWTRSDPTDVIGTTVGGNRYGWLVNNELPLALDNITRSGVAADLSIVKTDSPDPVRLGQNLTYSLSVQNAGPDSAASVQVSDTLPAGATWVSTSTTAGSCAGTSTITCSLGSLASGGTATVTIVVSPTATGTLTNTGTVSSTTADSDPANNSSTATTTVSSKSADLSVTKTDSPDPAHVGQVLTYTVLVTNTGPDSASGVTLTDTLPKATGFGSVATTQGTCTRTKTGVFCNLGDLANGAPATVTIVVKPTQKGTITNTVTVADTSPSDPNTANNTATQNTVVKP